MMIIFGKYKSENGLTQLFSNNTLYEIVSPSNWRCIKVGQLTATNHIFTQEVYDKWASEYTEYGTFELED